MPRNGETKPHLKTQRCMYGQTTPKRKGMDASRARTDAGTYPAVDTNVECAHCGQGTGSGRGGEHMTTQAMVPRITLTGLKVAAFMSEETLCFEATVRLDGKPFARAANDGHGGMTHVVPFRNYSARHDDSHDKAYWEASKLCAAAIPQDTFYAKDLEYVVDCLAEEMHNAAKVRRTYITLLRKCVVIVDAGKCYTIKAPPDERAFTAVRKRHPNAVILNRLPLAEALKRFGEAS